MFTPEGCIFTFLPKTSFMFNLITSLIILKVGYDATRYYWSFRRLNQRCRYRCRIVENIQLNRPLFTIEVIEEGFEDNLILKADSTRGKH